MIPIKYDITETEANQANNTSEEDAKPGPTNEEKLLSSMKKHILDNVDDSDMQLPYCTRNWNSQQSEQERRTYWKKSLYAGVVDESIHDQDFG